MILRSLIAAATALLLFLLIFVAVSGALLVDFPGRHAAGNWASVQPGMSRVQVEAILGIPVESSDDSYFYDLYPLPGLEGTIEFASVKGGVLSVNPREISPFWTSEATRTWLRQQYRDIATGFGLIALPLLALVSIVPYPRTWHPLYYPVAATVWGTLYESAQTGGWRFDLLLFVPLYAVIAIAWLVRAMLLRRKFAVLERAV
jgi:hypothetical protein